MATTAVDRVAPRPIGPNPLARVGQALWRLLTSVDFAVVQIIFLGLGAAVGMTIRQLPDFAFRSATDYVDQMDVIHALYDPLFGTAGVGALERLGVFMVFRSPWFSAALVVLVLSIVCCTINRIPRLWRGVSDTRVIQPEPFFDPRLPDRAEMRGVTPEAVSRVFRKRGLKVREGVASDGSRFVYGDRNQYTKLATLLTHLGLITFLLAAAVSSRLGDEQGLVVAEGESLTVQPIGTPGLLLVKNLGFEAPGMATGNPSDFTTDLAVYRDGEEIARKTIRVNDPLSIAGYTFHQNGFGAAPHLLISDADGRPLWDAPVPLTGGAAGRPYEILPVPGRDVALQLLLERRADGVGELVVLPYRIIGTGADGTPTVENLEPFLLERGGSHQPAGQDFAVGLKDFSDYTLLIAKHDPGQGLIWVAFLLLIAGITITFYLPRRRVWARLAPDGRLGLVWRSDRYVNVEREFGRLLDDLVAARQPA
jgi:cytochrome c biogenesis protein